MYFYMKLTCKNPTKLFFVCELNNRTRESNFWSLETETGTKTWAMSPVETKSETNTLKLAETNSLVVVYEQPQTLQVKINFLWIKKSIQPLKN